MTIHTLPVRSPAVGIHPGLVIDTAAPAHLAVYIDGDDVGSGYSEEVYPNLDAALVDLFTASYDVVPQDGRLTRVDTGRVCGWYAILPA